MSISTGPSTAAVSSASNTAYAQKSGKHHHRHHNNAVTSSAATKTDSIQISDKAKELAKTASAGTK